MLVLCLTCSHFLPLSFSDLIQGHSICRINFPSFVFFSPLLQWRSDFLKDRVRIPVNHEAQEECLGIAVLDMMRLAKESGQSPVSIFNDIRWDMLTQRQRGKKTTLKFSYNVLITTIPVDCGAVLHSVTLIMLNSSLVGAQDCSVASRRYFSALHC